MRLFLLFAILSGFYNASHGKGSLEIDMKLKALNKPALKTIKSEDGDIIDCIDIYKQHAFDNPALRNHKIQMKPSIESVEKKTKIPNYGSSEQITSQIWSKSGNCPIGTIPVRRVSKEEIRRASSPSHFGRKAPHKYSFLDNALQTESEFNITAAERRTRSESIIVAQDFNFLGGQSDLNVWNPPRVEASDFSSSQIRLLAGFSTAFESIEAGWMVNPAVFGDNLTRFFISWTRDGFYKTGCINLLCAGFVQTSHTVALGATFKPVSTTSGEQYIVPISIILDTNTWHWWLISGFNIIGYWPSTLFRSLKRNAIAVQWGGEVYSPNIKKKKPHTTTSMGSGEWAANQWAKASYHTKMRIKDNSLQIKYPKDLTVYASESACYSAYLETNMSVEPHFYFGGPGQNSLCP